MNKQPDIHNNTNMSVHSWTIPSPYRLLSDIGNKFFGKKEFTPSYILVTTLITTFLCYFYEMIWGLGCADTMCEGMFYYTNSDYSTSQARWMIRYLNEIFGKNTIFPAITILSYCFMIGISTYIICRMIRISNPLSQILITAMMISFPVVTHHFAFLYMALAFSFSFLMVVVGICFIRTRKVYGMLLGLLCFILMMGSYQAYIGAISALSIILLISDTLNNDRLKTGFLNIAFTAATAFVACILNSPISKLMMRLHHVSPDERVSAFSVKSIFENLGFTLKSSYLWFFPYFRRQVLSRHRIYAVIFSIIAILMIIILIQLIRMKKITTALVICISVLLIPLSMNLLVIILPSNGIRDLLVYQFVLIFPLLFIFHKYLGDMLINNLLKYITLISLVLMFIANVITANCTARLYKLCYDQYEQELTFALERIYQFDDYEKDITPIVTGGVPPIDYVSERYPMIFRYAEVEGNIAFWYNIYGMKTCRYNFFGDFLGVNAGWIETDEYLSIIQSDEYQQMPLWPESGSVKMIDGMAVIKFTDEPPLY